MVDPTGLKPAPHGLKGRCSVTRAPDQDIFDFRFLIEDWTLVFGLWSLNTIKNLKSKIKNDLAVAEGFEPSHGRINSAVPYQLGYATARGMRDERRGDGGTRDAETRRYHRVSASFRLHP